MIRRVIAALRGLRRRWDDDEELLRLIRQQFPPRSTYDFDPYAGLRRLADDLARMRADES